MVTLDGPSGAGKGTIGLHLAGELGWHFLDSGAMYRLTALAALRAGLDLNAEATLADLAAGLPVSFGSSGEPLLDGEDVGAELRTETTGNAASRVAALPAVREALLDRQRGFRRPPGLVADGRDMGTVVFPDAPVKVFLTASAEIRARRRYEQLREKGIGANLTDLVEEVRARDRRDTERATAPLRPAADAITVDTSTLDLAQSYARVLDVVRQRLASGRV